MKPSLASTSAFHWALLTGEYPPDPGGVSDYTQCLAAGLAAAGDQVQVLAPGSAPQVETIAGVTLHRIPGLLGWQGSRHLAKALAKLPSTAQLVVQYVPHAYGWKAMNVPLCLAIARHRPRAWTMFHEVSFGIEKHQSFKHNLLGYVTREMARVLARTSDQLFVSSASWLPLLEELRPFRAEPHWLPIFSSLPTHADPTAVQQLHDKWSHSGQRFVLGHFGTYGSLIAPLLRAVLAEVCATVDRTGAQPLQIMLIGRGGREFAQAWQASFPAWASQVAATGGDSPERTAESLAACDLLVQPYPDGVSTRRSGMMSILALGRPVVTNCSHLTEPCWTTEKGVELCLQMQPQEFAQAVLKLMAEPAERLALSWRAKAWYEEVFAREQTVRVLRATAEKRR